MYALIEKHRDVLFERKGMPKYVDDYTWLLDNLAKTDVSTDPIYQDRYRKFWALSELYLDSSWIPVYFKQLERAKKGATTLDSLCRMLYKVPSTRKGTQALQFSFCTKIAHMVDHSVPIFDSRIERFYCFSRPGSQMRLDRKLARYDEFMTFLTEEYARVLSKGLLRKSIADFRKRPNTKIFTDEKIIDTLIWAWTSTCGKQLMSGGIEYY